MKLLTIAVLLALAGCKQKPAPGLTFNSTTMPLKIEEVPETVKSATAPALAAAICDQGTGCIYTSAAGKEWHNDGKHWYKRGDHSREVQGDAHASSFGGDSRFTFDPQPSGEVKFGPVIATLDWSEPTAITTKESSCVSWYSQTTKATSSMTPVTTRATKTYSQVSRELIELSNALTELRSVAAELAIAEESMAHLRMVRQRGLVITLGVFLVFVSVRVIARLIKWR